MKKPQPVSLKKFADSKSRVPKVKKEFGIIKEPFVAFRFLGESFTANSV
jgi:hypothetical protein